MMCLLETERESVSVSVCAVVQHNGPLPCPRCARQVCRTEASKAGSVQASCLSTHPDVPEPRGVTSPMPLYMMADAGCPVCFMYR